METYNTVIMSFEYIILQYDLLPIEQYIQYFNTLSFKIHYSHQMSFPKKYLQNL